jgi:hypothetical protein
MRFRLRFVACPARGAEVAWDPEGSPGIKRTMTATTSR